MNRAQLGTIILVIAALAYGTLVGNVLTSRKVSFYRGIAIAAPGALLLLILYAWLALQFSITELAVFLLVSVGIIVLNAVVIKTAGDVIRRFLRR